MSKIQNMDLDSLLAEVSTEVEKLLKSQPSMLKKEESSKEESSKEASKEKSKEESSKEASKEKSKEESSSLEKDESSEGSGYESQAPEASEQSAPEQEMETLEGMISSLDDEMLHELFQKIKMELQGRSGEDQQPQQQAQAPQQAPVADAQPAPAMDAFKSEKEQGEKLSKAESELAKAQQELADLKKTTAALAEIVEKVISKPVVRAINDIQYVDKGEKALKKAELENVSDEELKRKLTAVTNDKQKMATLSKKEQDAILDFFSTKKRSNEVLEIIK